MFTRIRVSEMTRKQGIVIGIATGIAILLIFLGDLEVRHIVPGTTAMTGLYIAIFLVWPYLASVSGTLALRHKNAPGFAERAKAGLLSVFAVLVLAVIGISLILIANARVLDRDLPSILQTLMWSFKDTSYILFADATSNNSLLQGRTAKLLLGIFASFLSMACGAWFSSSISRPKTAAIAGYFAGLGISGAVLHYWIRLDLAMVDDIPVWEPGNLEWIIGVLGISTTLIFLCAICLNTNRYAKIWSRMTFAVGLSAIAFIALAYPHISQFSPISAVSYETPQLANDGGNIVVGVFDSTRKSLAPRIWRISVLGGEIAQLGGKHAYNPVLSPDGKWIAYLSQGTIFGFAQDRVDLWAIRVNGTQDHLLASGIADSPYFRLAVCEGLSFSPYGTRIAVLCDESLAVAALNQNRSVQIALPQGHQWLIAGWNSSETEVLIAPQMPPGPLLACNAVNKQMHVLIDNQLGRRNFIFPAGSKGIRYPLLENIFPDLSAGNEQSLARSRGYLADISADQSVIVYSTSRGSHFGSSLVEIHWFELSSGRDHIAISSEQGCLDGPFLVSPKGDRLVAWDCAEGGQTFVADRSGGIKYFPSEWKAFGWVSNDEVALWKTQPSIPLAIGNAANLTMKILRP